MRKEHGFSLVELLVVIAVILVLAAIAIPNLLRSRVAANEASAVGSLRAINTSEVTYNSTYNAYTCTLPNLGPPPSGSNPSSAAAGLIDSSLAGGNKSGYAFTAGTCGVGSSGLITSYQWLADPASPSSGTRHFCTDDTFNLKVDPNSSANCISIGTPIG